MEQFLIYVHIHKHLYFFYLVFYHTFGRFKPIYDQVSQPFYLAATMLLETIENTSLFSPFEIDLFYSLASSKYLCGGAKYFWITQSISPTTHLQRQTCLGSDFPISGNPS